MKKSTLNLVNTLKASLLDFPRIVSSLEKNEVRFLDQLLAWIINVENIFTTYNISDVSALAGFRSNIIAAKYSDNKGNSIKKLKIKIAAESLNDIQKVVLNVLHPLEIKVQDCRELLMQLLQIVSQTKLIKYDSSLPFDSLINDIWQFIISNDQLKPGAVKLKSNFSMSDIQLLIAEEIILEDF